MTGSTWGTASAGISEDQWREMMSLVWGDGVVPGALSTYEVYANSTGMRVFVRAGLGVIKGAWHKETADTELAIASNGSGLPRIDLVVGRFNDSTDVWSLAVVTGTPNASPTAPAASSINPYEIPLARVAVANGASTIAAGDVTDWRQYGYPNLGGMPRTIVKRAASQTITTGVVSYTDVVYDTVIDDQMRAWSSGAAAVVTLPSAGLYAAEFRAVWNNSATGRRYARMLLDGVQVADAEQPANPVNPHQVILPATFVATAGQALKVGVKHDVGSDLQLLAVASASTFLIVRKVG